MFIMAWLSDHCLKTANAHNITTGKVKKISAKFNEQKLPDSL